MEVFEVLGCRGLMVAMALASPILIELRMVTGLVVAIHAREDTRVVLAVDKFLLIGSRDVAVAAFLILAAHILGVALLGIDGLAGGVVLTRKERRVAVLLASQVGTHGNSILGGVLVERSVRVGTDDQKEEGRIANHQHQKAQNSRVDDGLVLLFGGSVPQSPNHQGGNQQEEEDGAAVEWQMQRIDKEDIESRVDIDNARDDAPQYQRQQHDGYDAAPDKALDCGLRPLAEIDHIHNGGNRKEVQQVDTDGNTHQQTHQHQPAQRPRVVGLFFPFQDSPEHHRGEE